MIGSLQQHALPVAMVLLCAAAMYLVYRDMRNMETRIGKIDAALIQLFEERDQLFGAPAGDDDGDDGDEHEVDDEHEGDDFDFCQFEVAATDAPAVAAEVAGPTAVLDLEPEADAPAETDPEAQAEPELEAPAEDSEDCEDAPAAKKTRAHKARAT